MAFENCNVKALLKQLVLNETEDRTSKKWCPKLKTEDRKAFHLLFTFLNSPHVISPRNHHKRWELKKHDEDNEYEIYNNMAKEIFYLKANGFLLSGDKLEKVADMAQSKKIDSSMVRFLLCLAWTDGLPKQDSQVDLYYGFSKRNQENRLSSWIDVDISEEQEKRGRRYFDIGSLEDLPQKNSVFSAIPGTHFMHQSSPYLWEKASEPKQKGETTLFGALTNNHSRSLDMTLALPEICQQPSSITFNSGAKLKLMSIDEGFIDDTTPSNTSSNMQEINDTDDFVNGLNVWTNCLHLKHQEIYTWERLKRNFVERDRKYFGECGPAAFDHLYNLRHQEALFITEQGDEVYFESQENLLTHSINVLFGLPSKSFVFNKARCSFIVNPLMRTYGLSPKTLHALMDNFAEFGSCYRQLNRFTQHHSEKMSGYSGGKCLEAFVVSLRKYLETYKYALMQIQAGGNVNQSLLKLWATFQEAGRQIKLLADICLCSVAFSRCGGAPKPKFPMGLKLVSYLYDFCMKNKFTAQYSLLLHLYMDTCAPFLRYITNWIFHGICRDPFGEFLVDVDHQYLNYQDKHYWTHGFVLKQSRRDIEMFDPNLVEQIYACGKAINLLKQTNPQHYLLNENVLPPSIQIGLSTEDIEKIIQDSKCHISLLQEARDKELRIKESMLNENMRKMKEIFIKKQKETLESLNKITAIETLVKKSMNENKKKELQRLKKQMEDAIKERKLSREQRQKEEKEYMKSLMQKAADEEEKTKKARDEMLAYYESLTQQATRREVRALWIVRRYELDEKRKAFIANDNLLIDQELIYHEDSNIRNAKDNLQNSAAHDGSAEAKRVQDHGNVSHGNEQEQDVKVFTGMSKLEEIIKDFESSQNSDRKIDDLEHDSTAVNVMHSDHLENEQDLPNVVNQPSKSSSLENVSTASHLKSEIRNSENKIEKENKHGKERVEMKALLYPDNPDGFSKDFYGRKEETKFGKINQVQSIKPRTNIKDILYHIAEPEVKTSPFTSIKVYEQKSRMKDLLYHYKPEETDEEVSSGIAKEEVWLELNSQQFPDNFDSMNLEPQPDLFDAFMKTKTNENEVIKDYDAVNQLPLEIIIKRSIVAPITAQINFVQTAAVEYFMDTLQIGVHFDAFRKFLLLEDGEFGHCLCNQIFEKAFTSASPKDFCIPTVLNNMVNRAMQISLFADKVEFSRQLTFYLKWIPEVIKSTDIAALDFLQLRYRVPWPCNIIVTENCITKYNKVFSFLLRLKMVNWALQAVWTNLKKAGRSRKASLSFQLRKLQLFRHEMQHFVNNVERYIVNQIIHISWREFQDDLQNNVHDVDDLHKYHVNYLNRIIFRSLLSKNAAPVLKIISDIFALILKFHVQLRSSSWEVIDNSFIVHSAFDSLCLTHKAFKEYTGFLFKVISKLIHRGYQHHLDDFLLQVNFNGYYQNAMT